MQIFQSSKASYAVFTINKGTMDMSHRKSFVFKVNKKEQLQFA